MTNPTIDEQLEQLTTGYVKDLAATYTAASEAQSCPSCGSDTVHDRMCDVVPRAAVRTANEPAQPAPTAPTYLTKREQFAMAALPQLIAHSTYGKYPHTEETRAEIAVAHADALLAALKREPL
jgi:hypothetical protein